MFYRLQHRRSKFEEVAALSVQHQVIGSPGECETALEKPEDSSSLNRSFIERMNPITRKARSYLTHRTTCPAHCKPEYQAPGSGLLVGLLALREHDHSRRHFYTAGIIAVIHSTLLSKRYAPTDWNFMTQLARNVLYFSILVHTVPT